MTTDTWDSFAADWDNQQDVRKYADNAFDSWRREALPLISNVAETRVLDFGCGTGLLTEKLAPHCQHIVAVDTSVEMIRCLRRKITGANVGNVTPLVTAIDFEAIAAHRRILGRFGLVVASSVCSFLPDFELTLCDIAKTMKPGGIFVHWDWADDMPFAEIRNAFAKAAMKCVSVENEFVVAGSDGSMPVVMGIGILDG